MPRTQAAPLRPARPQRGRSAALLSVAVAVALSTSACGGSGSSGAKRSAPPTMPAGPSCIKPESGSGCLPVAPTSKRVDLVRPTFSNPTSISNPLHPSSRIAQVIYGGQVDGEPQRTEFSLLPGTKAIDWGGQRVEAVTLQYLSFLDGRIEEVALDWFAQADDGAVWYFGEDVFNYADGAVADTNGSWIAGKAGPPAMIMPAKPAVGNVYRPENMPGVVFEEVVVKAVDQTVPGPSGLVGGALVVTELHMDGKREDKVFAPGYGEFSTGDPKGDLEVAALAVPTDARPGAPPAQLTAVSAAVRDAFDAVGTHDWTTAAAATGRLRQAWDAYRAGDVPDVLAKQMTRDVETLAETVRDRDPATRDAVLRVAQNDLDLHLRHRPVATTDRARFDLWARQLLVDAAAGDAAGVAGDVTTLEWVRDRIRHTLDVGAATSLDGQLRELRGAADAEDFAAAARTALALRKTIAAA
jgi:hypothetical protein